jgi:hypothetical protein
VLIQWLDADIQLVFFHPKFQFRDGAMRSGDDAGGANFARRSPWPMINILRTPQVRAAQKGVPTGVVYRNNEDRLNLVGQKTLEDMLYNRDWRALPSYASESKTFTRLAQEDAKIQLNLNDPLLTSLSDGSAVCPFNSAAASSASSTSPSSVSAAAPVSASITACPVMKQPAAVAVDVPIEEEEEEEEEEYEPDDEPVVVKQAEEEIDYMKLAEDVDAWLNDY